MAVAAIAALSSCTKEEDNNASLNDSNAFYATIEDGSTRTTLGTGDDANKVLWSESDKISINGEEYTLKSGTGTTNATFEGPEGLTSPFNAYYPASLYNGGTPTLPATQTYEAGKINNLPMYAQSTTHDLKFKNLCGVLAITVPQSEMTTVSSITVYADKQLNGAISVDYNSGDPTVTFSPAQTADEYKKVTLTFASAKTISTSETFYIAIPAQTYSTLDIVVAGEIAVTDGTVTAKLLASKAASMVVNRNNIYSITFSGATAIRGTTAVSSTAGRSGNTCGWVQLWNGGPKFAEFNVGATISDYANATVYNTANVGGLYRWCATVPNNMRDNSSASDDHSTSYNISTNDTSKKLWGDSWLMPEKAQLEALNSTENCDWSYCDGETSLYASGCTLKGWKVSGKAGTVYASNNIFLPLAGYTWSGNGSTSQTGVAGYYWSTALDGSDNAYRLDINNENKHTVDSYYITEAFSVRPVLKEN